MCVGLWHRFWDYCRIVDPRNFSVLYLASGSRASAGFAPVSFPPSHLGSAAILLQPVCLHSLSTPSQVTLLHHHLHWEFCLFVCLLVIGDHFWSSFWFSNKQHFLSVCLFVGWVLNPKIHTSPPVLGGTTLCRSKVNFNVLYFCVLPSRSQHSNYIRNRHRWCVVIRKSGNAWPNRTTLPKCEPIIFVHIVVCACSRHALGFKTWFFGSFVCVALFFWIDIRKLLRYRGFLVSIDLR